MFEKLEKKRYVVKQSSRQKDICNFHNSNSIIRIVDLSGVHLNFTKFNLWLTCFWSFHNQTNSQIFGHCFLRRNNQTKENICKLCSKGLAAKSVRRFWLMGFALPPGSRPTPLGMTILTSGLVRTLGVTEMTSTLVPVLGPISKPGLKIAKR